MADTKRLLETVEFDTIPVGTLTKPSELEIEEPEYKSRGSHAKPSFSDDDFPDIATFHALGGDPEEPEEPVLRVRRIKTSAKPSKSPWERVYGATLDSSEKRSFMPEDDAIIDELIAEDSPTDIFFMTHSKEEVFIDKSDEIKTLESILSQEYDREIEINKISELPMTRKKVKEVYFSSDDWISKVWVFKAEPGLTSRELAIYHIAHELQIPTGKPIGFDIAKDGKSYPFDIAILGGIVEHAGEPYNELLTNLVRSPHKAFGTAIAISKMIADYHVKLTHAANNGDFAKHDVDIGHANPRKEIKDRLLAALYLKESHGKKLIAACEQLYDKYCCDQQVVSHGDLHTGNLVTLISKKWNIPTTSLKEFGLIDWGSLMFDNPYGDLTSFWLHHQRQAMSIFKDYDYIVDDLIDNYQKQFNKIGEKFGLSLDMKNSVKKSVVQSTLWNIYELFDPVRVEIGDVEDKAYAHARLLRQNLKELENIGCKEQAYQIRKQINILMKKQKRFDSNILL